MSGPNVPIGGDFLNSLLSTMYFVPFNSNQTFTALTVSGGIITAPSGNVQLDVVRGEAKRNHKLADATTTGLWYHTGVRQLAVDMEWRGKVLWNADNPVSSYITFLQNTSGFQLFATMGSAAQNLGGQVLSYYWCPSVFVEVVQAVTDVSGGNPKLVEVDLVIKPNSPCFYKPTVDDTQVTAFLAYIVARGWSF